MTTSKTLGTAGIALGIAYGAARYFGVIGGEESAGSGGGTIATGNMAGPGEDDTTIEERGQRRRQFAGVEREPETTASDVNDETGGSDLPNTSTDSMAADGEETTLRERGERRAAFAGADTSGDDSNTSATGNLEADSEDDTTVEERGERRAAFAGSSGGSSDSDDSDSSSSSGSSGGDDYEETVEDNVGRDSGTGGVSGL